MFFRQSREILLHALPMLIAQLASMGMMVIDTALPLMPASQLLRELRALGFSGPALLLEDPAQPVDPAALADDGPLHCLRKPLEMQHVFRAVDAMLAEAANASAPA